MVRRTLAAVAVALLAGGIDGCTFGNLAGYEVQACDPVAPASDARARDACNVLNGDGSDPCMVWQCDPRAKRCVRGPRDDDRDGDPAVACGGTDCDDTNPARSGLRAKEPTPTVPVPGGLSVGSTPLLTTDSGDEPSATWVTPLTGGHYCLQATRVDGTSPLAGSCAMLEAEPGLAPAQPFARWIAGTPAAAFVAQTPAGGPCDGGAISFRFGKVVSTASACDAKGAALPSFVVGPDGVAVVGYYATAFRNRSDPTAQCASATSAALTIRSITKVAATSATLGAPQSLDAGISFRPPALAAVDGFAGVLVASPTATGIGVWALSAGAYSITAQSADDSVASIRGVSMATARGGETARIAIVKEVGCDHGSLHLSVFDFDIASTKLRVGKDVEVTNSASVPAFRSSVARVSPKAGGGWLVTWLVAGGQGYMRRFQPDGTPLGAPAAIPGMKALDAIAGSNGEAYFVKASAAEDLFYRATLRCP